MKKTVKALIIFLCLLTVVGVFPITSTAATVNETYVQNKITALKNLFPDGSYFTTTGTNVCKTVDGDGSASWCDGGTSCETCRLEYLLSDNCTNTSIKTAINQVPVLKNIPTGRASCCGFATFAFCYIFEHDYLNNSTVISTANAGITDEFLSSLKPGDLVKCYTSMSSTSAAHWNIFLGYDSKYVYFYESNTLRPNRVEYNNPRSRNGLKLKNTNPWVKLVAFRSNTHTSKLTVKDNYKITADDYLTIRSTTDTNSASRGTIPTGTVVTVTKYDNNGNWGYVTYNGVSGWIRLYYVEKTSSSNSSGSGSTPTQPTNDIWLLSPPDGVLSMRTGATTSATKICDIPGGKYITVTKYANDGKWDWGYTTYNGQSGWVCLYYATKHTTHAYGSWQTVTAATCTTAGSQKRTCGCGAVETKSVSALGHNYSSTYTVDKAATCTEAGSKSKHCTRCSATTSVTSIPPTGHTYGGWQTVTNATCTTAGSQKRTCACGAVETQSIPASGHSFGAWTTEKVATCIAEGKEFRKCSTCGNYSTRAVSALGHNYSSSFTIDKAATCTVAGSKSKHCTRCSATTEVTAIPATGHSYGSWQIVSAATCTATGSQKRSCTSCGNTEYRTISALGHNYSSSWTVDKAATCTTSGTKSHHCTRCEAKSDITTVPALEHSWSGWTVTKQATVDSTGLKVRKCTNSGCTSQESAVIAKLAADGHTHDFGEWFTETAATCTADGVQKRICSDCKAYETLSVSAKGHSFGEWSVEKNATCTEGGTQKRGCSTCSETETLSSPAIGHSFGEWTVKIEATAETEGSLERKCADCSETETQSTPKLNGSANTSSTASTDGNSSKPDVSDKDTSSAPQNKSDLTTVIVICSVAIGAILAALVVLVIIKKKK